jgi:hypothetical protein
MMPSALAVFGLMAGPMRSGLMSLLGQNQKSQLALVTSASPPETDIVQRLRRVRFVPIPEVVCAGNVA